jgi:hypothetical protein
MVLAYDPSPPAVTDLGDLHMTEAPLLVAGIVSTAEGVPIAGATVGVHRCEKLLCALAERIEDSYTGPGPIYSDDPIDRFRQVSDAGGRFTIRGSSSAWSLRLDVSHPGRAQVLEPELFFRRGATDVRILLVPDSRRSVR